MNRYFRVDSILIYLIISKLLFSYSSDFGIHENINKSIDVAVIIISLYTIVKYRNSLLLINFRILLFSVLYMIYVVLVNSFYEVGVSALLYYSRFFVPILLYVALGCCYVNYGADAIYKKIPYIIILVVFLTVLGFLFMPMNFNHGELKLPTYFSGLHKSSYILSFLIICGVVSLRYTSPVLKLMISFCVLFMFYMVVEGWGIRTPMLAVIVFFVLYFMKLFSVNIRAGVIFFGASVFVMLLIVFGGDVDWNKVSSGRLQMWEFKIDMYSDASLVEAFFGRGYGSDYVEIGGWWGEKDSHNNYLQTLTELGLFGLFFLLGIIFLLYNSQKTRLSALLVVVYALTGMFSNGVIYRLVPGYIFVLIIMYFQSVDNVLVRKKNEM
ncbi:MAG: hypothetical protein MJK15_18275 [Colwellia sp.]|nr:hypothetical protein [Colwellia sp.]